MWLLEESWAGRLTVRSARPVGASQRRRIRHRFEALDAYPAMPPAAMLFVRRMCVEAPTGRTSSATWDLIVRERLARLYETAARPAEGLSDPVAEAVVFPDEATMIACLLADIRQGRAAELWWWRSVWSRGVLPRAAGAILAARPEQAPAVFRALERMGEAVRVAALLEREEAAALVRAMLGAHAAPDLARAIDAARFAIELTGNSFGSGRSPNSAVAPSEAGFDLAMIPAGLPRPLQGSEGLPPENRVLVGLALGLAVAPLVIRSAEFAVRAAEWLRAQFSGVVAVPVRAPVARNGRADMESAPQISPSEAFEQRRIETDQRTRLTVPRMREAAGFGEDTRPVAESTEISSPTAPPAVQADSSATDRWDPVSRINLEPAVSPPVPYPEVGIRTRIGGVLYLIAAFERLGIPDCFEPNWPFSSYLSRWGVLELVARGLLSAVKLADAYRDDPFWIALAQINGRDHGLSGFQNFPAQDSFRVPANWLPELLGPDEAFALASRRRRIAVWSRAGWLLVDRPLGTGERADFAARAEVASCDFQATSVVNRLPWSASPHVRLGGELRIAPALEFWLECTLSSIRTWLGRAMGLDKPDFAPLVETLLLVPGELFVTPTRVDFHAPLEQTRIPVRRAALDLDPGWLPAWGRSIRFHYGDASGGLR